MTAGAASTLGRLPGIDAQRAEALALRAAHRGTMVTTPEDPDFPIADDIPHTPAVLFIEGRRPEVLRAPRVAVVGTRAASVHGLTDAWELGAFLGAAGITVVSGLAIGIAVLYSLPNKRAPVYGFNGSVLPKGAGRHRFSYLVELLRSSVITRAREGRALCLASSVPSSC